MNRQLCFFLVILFAVPALACQAISMATGATPTPAVTPTPTKSIPEAGYWITTPEEFGQISFLVDNEGSVITEIKLLLSDWSCGDRKLYGYSGAEEQYPIQDEKFTLTMYIVPSTESIFESLGNTGTFTITGSFAGTSKASGTWEFDFTDSGGEKCTGTWNANYSPDMTGSTPISTQAANKQPPDQPLQNGEESQATDLQDIAGVWLETFSGGSAHLEIQPDGDTIFTIISGSNQRYQDRGKYWFENGELHVQTEGGDIGKYIVYVTWQDGKAASLRYEAIDDPFDARREAMTYAPLTRAEAASAAETGSASTLLDILGCNPTSECPESAISIRSFFEEDEDLLPGTEYPVSLSPDTQLRFFTGWCTLEQELLDQNLEHIEFVFEVDGVSCIDQLSAKTFTEPDPSDPAKLNYCHSVGGVASGWQEQREYRIVFGMKFDENIFDGWDNYAPGDYTLIYLVSAAP